MKKITTQILIESAKEGAGQLKAQKLDYNIHLFRGDKDVAFSYFETGSDLVLNVKMQEYLAQKISAEIKKLIGPKKTKILIVGLGNSNLVADSLGDKTVSRIIPNVVGAKTHLYLLKAGVFGATGIESATVVKALVQELNADLVIAIDTLVAREARRLGTSFQLSMGGITPGAGVGNARKKIDEKYLKVPVLLIGVPMVIMGSDLCKEASELILSQKDTEMYIKCASRVIALAINNCFNGFNAKDIYEYFA